MQRGTPLHVVKELGGWETMEMVQRYAHMSADHSAQWVQSISNDGVLIREVNVGANNLLVALINDMRLDVYARQVNFMRAQKQTG